MIVLLIIYSDTGVEATHNLSL